jgi:hypothetical protein
MAEFMLALSGDPQNWKGRSESEEKEIMNTFRSWVYRLADKKQYKECTKLVPKMAQVSAVGDRITVDGPFTETKEIYSGIFLIEATDFEEAVAIAKTCPMLARGEKISVLPTTQKRE